MIRKTFALVFALAVSGVFGQSTDWLPGDLKKQSRSVVRYGL